MSSTTKTIAEDYWTRVKGEVDEEKSNPENKKTEKKKIELVPAAAKKT